MSAQDWDVAIAAEGQDYIESAAPLITRPFDYGVVITYPFIPHHWQQTRFSDGLHYGVWYGSFEIETTIPNPTQQLKVGMIASLKVPEGGAVGKSKPVAVLPLYDGN